MPGSKVVGRVGGDQRIDLPHDLRPVALGRDPGPCKRHERRPKFTLLFTAHQVGVQRQQVGIDLGQFCPKVIQLQAWRKGVIGGLLQPPDLPFDQITPTRELSQTQLQARQAVDQIGRPDRN